MAKENGNILIIDDDEDVLLSAKMVLKRKFSNIRTAQHPEHLERLIRKEDYDVVLLDMNFQTGAISGKEGLHWLKFLAKKDASLSVILMTAYGDIELAVAAMKEGAIDFVVKPWDNEKLLATVTSAWQLSRSKREVQQLKAREKTLARTIDKPFSDIIGQSAPMQEVFNTIKKVAGTDVNVLILGENGTGKEVIARALHRHSRRAEDPCISVDLGAIPETLFESELFGHVKGAFTDARDDRAGRFEIAAGGTLFLDEIGNLSLPLQAKLLTVLQSREVLRVGSNKPVPIDIRLICATNMPLYEMVEKHQFRQDLVYRINTVEIKLPPLRERKDDVPLLVDHYLGVYTRKYQKEGMKVGKETMRKLQQYHWPGNIRELQHALERAVILSDSLLLKPEDFMLNLEKPREKAPVEQVELSLEEMEKRAIQTAIRKHDGNLTQAAKELGLGRTTLYRKMNKYGL